MEFFDELPETEARVKSPEIISELQTQPGKWGLFYVQGPNDSRKSAYSHINGLRIYVMRKNLPVRVRAETGDDDVTRGYAMWYASDDSG